MPGDNVTQEFLEMNIALNNAQALAASKKFSQRVSKDLGMIRKTTGILDKQLQGMHKKLIPATKRWEIATKRVEKAEGQLMKISLRSGAELFALQRKLIGATAEETKAIEKQAAALDARYSRLIDAQKAKIKLAKMPVESAKKDKESDEAYDKFTGYTKSKAGEDMFDGFKDGIQSLSSKDFGGLIKGLVGGIGSGLKGAGAGLARGAEKSASGPGGPTGIMKAIAPMMKSMGPILNTLGKMGPLLGAMSSSIVGIVKLMLDAEAAAKDMNKEILASAGSSEYLSGGMHKANAAASDLGDTLQNVRDAATSLDNMKWGITKDTHTAVIGALTAEGVSLKSIEKQFTAVANSSKEATGYAKDWGGMVQMSVAYGRSFGVSLNEITNLQGEMMGEIGMGLNSVQASFQGMLQGAEQAGIASNKFFGIIRGISSDMSLFNNRMQDSVKLLASIGKVMSPRNAQKFMSTITGFTKGMGLMDRTKSVMLGGGAKKVGGGLQKDLNRKLSGLAEDIDSTIGAGSGKELIAALATKNPKMITKFMAKHNDKLSGAQNEAIIDAMQQQSKLTKGGLVDVASALKDASPFAVMDHLDEIGKNLFGKPIDELTDVQRLAAEQAAGISEELQDQMGKMKMGINQMQANLAHKLTTGAELTLEEQKLMTKLNATGITTGEQVEKLNARDLWDKMSSDQQKELQNSTKEINFQEKTSGFQTSMLDKLGVLMDWLMNKLYNVMTGIWEGVLDIWSDLPWGDKKAREQAKMEVTIAKTKNKDLMDAFEKAGGDKEKYRKSILEGKPGTGMREAVGAGKEIADLKKQEADLDAQLQKATTAQEKQVIQAKKDAAFKKRTGLEEKLSDVAGAVDNQVGDWVKRGGQLEAATAMYKSAGEAGLSSAKATEIYQATLKGKSLSESTAGLSPEEFGKFYGKAMEKLSAEQLTYAAAQSKIPVGTAAAPAAGPAAAPSAQAQAAHKAADPGKAATAPAAAAGAPVAAAPAAAAPPNLARAGATAVKNSSAAVGLNEEQLAALTETGSTLADIYKALRVHGVRMDWKFHKDDAESIIEKGVLEGSRQSLLEYFVYSADKEGTMKALKEGKGAKDIGADALKAAGPKQPGNAAGGVPMRPATGEVFASIKPLSEAIIPLDKLGGGGGGAVIELRTTGDLTRFIDARVIDGNVKFNKNAKTR